MTLDIGGGLFALILVLIIDSAINSISEERAAFFLLLRFWLGGHRLAVLRHGSRLARRVGRSGVDVRGVLPDQLDGAEAPAPAVNARRHRQHKRNIRTASAYGRPQATSAQT